MKTILNICFSILLSVTGRIDAQVEYDFNTKKWNNKTDYKKNELQSVTVKNINRFLYNITMDVKELNYTRTMPISFKDLYDLSVKNSFNKSTNTEKEFNRCDYSIAKSHFFEAKYYMNLFFKKLSIDKSFISKLEDIGSKNYTFYNCLDNNFFIDNNINKDTLNFFYSNIKDFTQITFPLNVDDADAIQLNIKTEYANIKDSISKRFYLKNYWSFNLSSGFYLTSRENKIYEWGIKSTEYQHIILDTTYQFQINERKSINHEFGINLLTHVFYNFTPSFSIGGNFGLGSSLASFSPNIQYGLSFAFLKKNRIILNIGGNLTNGVVGVIPEISKNGLYNYNTTKNYDLNNSENLQTDFKLNTWNISINYQIF